MPGTVIEDKQPETEFVIDDTEASDTEQPEEEKPDPVELQRKLAETERYLEEERRRADKADEQAGFWFDQTQKKLEAHDKATTRPQEADDDDDIVSDEEYGEVLSDKKKFVGLVTKVADKIATKRASQMVNSRTTEITQLEQHFQRLPDLRDLSSEIAQTTAAIAKQMRSDPRYAKWTDYQVAERAIEQAEVHLLRQGKLKSQEPPEPEETQPPTKPAPRTEAERRAGIQAQSPSKGRKPSPPGRTISIPADQLALMEKHAKGLGIPVEQIVKNIPNVVKFRG